MSPVTWDQLQLALCHALDETEAIMERQFVGRPPSELSIFVARLIVQFHKASKESKP